VSLWNRGRRYRRQLMRAYIDWAQLGEWLFDDAMRTGGREKPLRRLSPPPGFAAAHEELLAACVAQRERRAARNIAAILEADFAMFAAADRLRAALDGAASADERAYAEAVRAILDTAQLEFERAVARADEADAKAVARMRAIRPPSGRETAHAACASAFAANVDALAGYRHAILARDREAAGEAWRHVEATNANLSEALQRASPDD
jgi:hypothetical protein